MTTRQGDILWRLARLHPAWMCSWVMLAFGLIWVSSALTEPAQASGGAQGLGYLATSMLPSLVVPGYAFVVVATVSGRFYSRRPRRLRVPVLAMISCALVPCIIASTGLLVDASIESLEPGDWHTVVVAVASSILVLAVFYLIIRASQDLVEAERGFGGGTGRKVGTFILFVFWIFGVFFIQARLQRLVQKFEGAPHQKLPMEVLELREQPSGNLSLLLTRRKGPEDFDAYATEFLQRLDAHVAKKSDLPDAHLWDIEIEGSDFQLLLDNPSIGLELRSQSISGDLLLDKLRIWLAPVA